MNDKNTNPDSINAQKKLELELEKLVLENKELSRKWYQKPGTYAAILPSIVTLILLSIGFKQDYVELKMRELKDNQNKLQSTKDSILSKKKDNERQMVELLKLKASNDSLESINFLRLDEIQEKEKQIVAKSNKIKSKEQILYEKSEQIAIKDSQLIQRKNEIEKEFNYIKNNKHQVVALMYVEELLNDSLLNQARLKLAKYISALNNSNKTIVAEFLDTLASRDTISVKVKAYIYLSLQDATCDFKWHRKFTELYAYHMSEFPDYLLSKFGCTIVCDSNFYETDFPDVDEYNYDSEICLEDAKLLISSLRTNTITKKHRYLIYDILTSLSQEPEQFEGFLSKENIIYLQRNAARLYIDMLNNPQIYSGKSNPNSINELNFTVPLRLLFSLNAPQLIPLFYHTINKNNIQPFRFDGYNKLINYINYTLSRNNPCNLGSLPKIDDSKEKWYQWYKANPCIFDELQNLDSEFYSMLLLDSN